MILSQFAIQYGINTCCLRAPWIMEKDDFRYSLSFGDDVFGGPVWNSLVAPEVAKRCQAEGTVPLLRDARGDPLKRNFVHVEDLVAAILAALDNPLTGNKLYNICMDEPVDYGAVVAYLKETRGLDYLDIASNYHSNWMDNSRAKFELGWRPRYDLALLIDAAMELPARTRLIPAKCGIPAERQGARVACAHPSPSGRSAARIVVACAPLGRLISTPVFDRNAQTGVLLGAMGKGSIRSDTRHRAMSQMRK